MKEMMEADAILSKIYVIRGHKVMLDRDLADLYGVETRVLNQAVSRNITRFPADFMFQLNDPEFKNLMSQIVISNREVPGSSPMPLPSRVWPCFLQFLTASVPSR